MPSSIDDAAKSQQRSRIAFEKRAQAELRNLEEQHQKSRSQVRAAQDEDLRSIRTQHEKDIFEATDAKEKKLQELRQSLIETKETTDKQVEMLKTHQAKTRAQVAQETSQEVAILAEKHQLKLEDENLNFNDRLRNLTTNQQMTEETIKNEQQRRLKDLQITSGSKLEQERGKFHSQISTERAEFEKNKNNLLDTNKKFLKDKTINHQNKLNTIEASHLQNMTKLSSEHNRAKGETTSTFEKEFEKITPDQIKAYKNLEVKFKDFETKLQSDLLKRTEILQDKSKDPFFTFVELRPVITEEADKVIVTLALPEYAKEEVLFKVNPKEIIISSVRKYQDARKNDDGIEQNVHKIESTNQKIPIPFAVLNPKKVEKNYQDGALRFVITKA